MTAATEQFLDKIDRLARLMAEMTKNFDDPIIAKLGKLVDDLDKLKEFVEQDKCLNAGGKFEWVDSVLVKCLQEGKWLLVDQVNLCSPAVLDRLNGLLEPNGVLSIGERGVDADGNVVTVKPHKNFRLFLTMDPKYGEISRAMRNRGVEIYMLSHNENPETGKLDYRSLLHNSGVTKRNHQEALMTVHRRMCDDPSNVDNLNVIHLQRSAFLVAQRLSRGFPASRSFQVACADVYLKSRTIGHRDTKLRLASMIEDTIREFEVDEGDDYVLDLVSVTCGTRYLRDNARLSQLKQQGTLLDWCVKGYLWMANNSKGPDSLIDLNTDYINEFFAAAAASSSEFPSVGVLEVLPYVLLNLYEHSTPRDAEIRQLWVSSVLKGDSRLGFLDEKNKALARRVLSFDFGSNDAQLPWDRKAFAGANALALILYHEALIVNDELKNSWAINVNETTISVGQFSRAYSEGKMTINLKHRPLITDYVTLLMRIEKYLSNTLRKNAKTIDDSRYTELRHKLKWLSRFGEIGKMILLNKTGSSRDAFDEHLDEVALVLKVHYRWLKKFIRLFDESCQASLNIDDLELKNDRNALRSLMEEIDRSLASVYDPFVKIGKAYKRHIDSPLPCSSEIALNACTQLQSLADAFSPSRNKYISSDLTNEPKFATYLTEEVLAARAQMVSLWHAVYANEPLDNDVFETLESISKLCQTRLNVTESEEHDLTFASKALLAKQIVKTTTKIQLWPLHEHMFAIFVEMFQRELCERMDKGELDSLPLVNLSNQHSNIPNIPIELLAVMNAIATKQNSPVERNRLLFALFIWFHKFDENSYAFNNFKRVSRWNYVAPEGKDKMALPKEESSMDRTNLPSGPVLISLVSELLLDSRRSSREKSSLTTGVTLGSYSARLEQLETLNDVLWKNSVALNSTEFDRSSNDLRTLQSLLNKFSSICEKVDADEYTKKALENDRLTASTRATVESEYLKPLRELRELSKVLETDGNSVHRGKAWALLGYLQAFIYGNASYIDPVYKVAIKLRYVEQDIQDSEQAIYVAKLYSRILGLTDEHTLHPRLAFMETGLKGLTKQKSELQSLKAVRPSNAEFIALSKEFANFRAALGSYAIVSRHVQQLIETTMILEIEVNKSNLESTKLAKREAEIWLESLRSFMNQIESRFLSGYPDIVLPILAGLAQMRHGVRILVDETSRRVAIAETNNVTELEQLLRNLARFPSLGPDQDSLLCLAKSCCSRESRELLSTCVKSDDAFVVLQEQFRLTIAGLYEYYNYVTLRRGSLTKELWSSLNVLLQQILLIWRQQQKEMERREAEKESMYKSSVKLYEDLTEEEEIAKELRKLFPTHRERDFADVDESVTPSLEKKIVVESAAEEDFANLITDSDIEEVQTIHSNIVKSFTASEWLKKKTSPTRPDFIEPLIQRYNTFGLLFDSVATALEDELTVELYPSLNVFTQLVARLGKGETLCPESWLSAAKKNSKPYDYYRDSNVEQVRQCAPLLNQIASRVAELLDEWPEHPTLLSIDVVLRRINSFPVTSALARFLVGLELLLVKLREWEETAHSGVSLQEYSLNLTQQIIAWRQLELGCWKDCLATAQTRLAAKSSKWWFFLYDLFESFVVKREEEAAEENAMTSKKLIESLEKFMSESSLVEFEPRLQLLLTCHCHAYYLEASVQRDELLAISWNVFNYYSQFLTDVSNQINAVKAPIEKQLRDFVKIARWNDISYWAVKETVEKTHRTLHKFIKEYENGLKEPVTPFLNVRPNYKSAVGIWDRPQTAPDTTIQPDDYVTSAPANEIEAITSSPVKSDVITRVDSHYLVRAKKLCKETVSASRYPDLRSSLEEFIEEYVSYSERLRNQDINTTLPKPKQKSQAKAILSRKRAALADYFKTLTSYGVSQRLGSLAWKNKTDDVLDFKIPPIEVAAALGRANLGTADRRMLDQWEGCERYYYSSLIKLNALNRTLLTSKTDLGIQNIEACRGFSTHLMLMANNQKKTLASVLKYFAGLRSHISDLVDVQADDFTATRQTDLRLSAEGLKELLVTAQTCLEQFLIYLQACPIEAQMEGKDESYSLALNDSPPIVGCKRGDAVWNKANEQIKKCLAAVMDISNKYGDAFPELGVVCESIITSKHFGFLKSSFESLKSVRDGVKEFATVFKNAEKDEHPLLENITFLETSIANKLDEFDKITAFLERESVSDGVSSLASTDSSEYESEVEKLLNNVLLVIQNKFKDKPVKKIVKKSEGEENEDEEEEEEEEVANKLREKLVESVEADVKSLKLREIFDGLNELLKGISRANSAATAVSNCRLLKKCLPLLQQYLLLAQYFLSEQVASLRITCKILHKQLNVFLDLAANGFCVPKDLDLEEGDEGEQSQQKGGMGLGDGEGEKDVSETIETEDQLEDAKPAGQEKEKQDDKEIPEEEKGIEMSEDFEGQLQDVEKKEGDEEDNDKEENEDMDKQMGETEDGADKLDEQIWGDDEEEPQSEETNKNEDAVGDGEETGEKEFGAKDERGQKEDSENRGGEDDDEREEQQPQKEINEMEEPQYDDDQVNPYHGKHQPEPEPEPLDLPEDANMGDEDENEGGDEQQNEENPFDIDKMKEAMQPPPEEELVQEPENVDEEMKDESEKKNTDSSDEEDGADDNKEKPGEQMGDKDETANEEEAPETDKQGAEQAAKDTQEEEAKKEEEKKDENEDAAAPSMDDSAMETDAAEQVDQREGGSRDQVANQADDQKQDEPEDESRAENWQEERQDKGTGESRAEQHDAGHSGASDEKTEPTANRESEMEQTKKRKNPGKSDEDHKLAEKIEPDRKKVKTMIYSQDEAGGNEEEEGAEPEENNGDPDLCQHVKEKEKFDHYAVDAATEEQSKEQVSNMEQDEEQQPDKEEEQTQGDVDMHEDEEVASDETVAKQKPETTDDQKSKDKKGSKEKGRAENDQLENAAAVEGEEVKTSTVARGGDSTFVTNLAELEVDLFSSKQIEQRRGEVEKMLSEWTQVPTTEEAVAAWNTLSAVTDAAARDLSEKLRLVLEPTQASRLKGDYRTGRRINMRKIIPYIASQFRKDKIWLRRTKPSKRDYQIVLAIDDSSSMADNHSKELAFESLSLISKAMTYLEAGQLGVLSFGEKTSVLHPLGETFSERSGSRLMQEMRFDQKRTMVHQLVDFTVDMFQNLNSSSDNAKLLIVLSDGRGVDSEGMQKVNNAVRRARLADIFLVFIIVDNPNSKNSILDIKKPIFQDGKVVGMSLYMDDFPFPFYMILRDINTLPGVLSDALRQWFEVVGKIDT